MNCPKCDLQTLPDQKVCRACGAGLQLVTQPLADYAAVSDLEGTPAITFKAERQRTNKMTASRKPNNLFTIYDLRFTIHGLSKVIPMERSSSPFEDKQGFSTLSA